MTFYRADIIEALDYIETDVIRIFDAVVDAQDDVECEIALRHLDIIEQEVLHVLKPLR